MKTVSVTVTSDEAIYNEIVKIIAEDGEKKMAKAAPEEEETETPTIAKRATRAKRGTAKAAPVEEEETEETETPTRAKRATRAKRGTAKAAPVEEEETEETETPTRAKRATRAKRGTAKAAPVEEETEETETPTRAKRATRAKRGTAKAAPVEEEETEETENGIDALKKLAAQLANLAGDTNDVIALNKEFGVKRIAELDPEDFGEYTEALNELIQGY